MMIRFNYPTTSGLKQYSMHVDYIRLGKSGEMLFYVEGEPEPVAIYRYNPDERVTRMVNWMQQCITVWNPKEPVDMKKTFCGISDAIIIPDKIYENWEGV